MGHIGHTKKFDINADSLTFIGKKSATFSVRELRFSFLATHISKVKIYKESGDSWILHSVQ